MRRLPLKFVAGICAVIAQGSTIVLAQAQPQPPPSETVPQPQQQQQQLAGHLLRGDEAVGFRIYNQAGENIGVVRDILFDENTGAISHAILGIGGWLGIGEHNTAVPWRHLTPAQREGGGLVVDLSKERLRESPRFDTNDWREIRDEWLDRNDAFFGVKTNRNIKLVRLTEANGSRLYNLQNEDIGEVHDTLVDPSTGRVLYGVISIGHHVGVEGNRLTIVPWELLRERPDETPGYVVHADREKLRAAEHFEHNVWPNYSDSRWRTQTQTYWGGAQTQVNQSPQAQ